MVALEQAHRHLHPAQRPAHVGALRGVVRRLPCRRAGELHAAARRLAEAARDVVGQRRLGPGLERAAPAIGGQRRRPVGEGRPSRQGAAGQRHVPQQLRPRPRHAGAPAAPPAEDHGLEQHQRPHPLGRPRGREQARGRAHGVAGEHRRRPVDLGQQPREVVGVDVPRHVRVGVCGQPALAMAPQVRRPDAQGSGEGLQHAAIGLRVEAVGVDEDGVHRPRGVAEVEHRHLAVGQAQRASPWLAGVLARGAVVHAPSPTSRRAGGVASPA